MQTEDANDELVLKQTVKVAIILTLTLTLALTLTLTLTLTCSSSKRSITQSSRQR